jgi:hypothetical protein
MKRPRCARNVDVLRATVVVKTADEMEKLYEKLKNAYKVVRVENTHGASTDALRGGCRSLLVNFIFEPGLYWEQLVGSKVTFDMRDDDLFRHSQITPIEENDTEQSRAWLEYVGADTSGNVLQKFFALQGLQVIASEHSTEPVRMIAELQFVLEPYFQRCEVSNMLFKIARCDSGAMEMVRDFFEEYFHLDEARDASLQLVKNITNSVNGARPQAKRVPVAKFENTVILV